MTLINQPTLMPTRKVSAAVFAGILANAGIALVDAYWPGVGTAMGPQISSAITAVVMVVASYLTRERAS